jgi:hypothetical protein
MGGTRKDKVDWPIMNFKSAYLWQWAQMPWLFRPGHGVPVFLTTEDEISKCYHWLVTGEKYD